MLRSRLSRTGIILIVGLSGAALIWWVSRSESEKVVEVLVAPNHKFTVVITQTHEHWPYGVEGHVYVADTAGEHRTHAVSYHADDFGELVSHFRWSKDAQAFEYWGKANGVILLSPEHLPRP